MNIEEIIIRNYEIIADAIVDHYDKYAHSSYYCELLLFVDEAEKVSFKSEFGCSRNKIVFDNYYVIFGCGGYQRGAWAIIGNALTLLKSEGMYDVLEEIAVKKNIDINYVTEIDAEAYIEEVYPRLLEAWLEETHERNYDDEYCYAENCINEFLEKLEELDEFEELDELDEDIYYE
ncbi:hypothetical protein [Ruminococcus flavefaciens]|uniref:hypothetical protein n=1 Tax=Ruminococcus flavefaciens TaxID=1265 RepID=UPI00048EE4B6|nr:hypothetical protein [Ruminococcus flavefaciens]